MQYPLIMEHLAIVCSRQHIVTCRKYSLGYKKEWKLPWQNMPASDVCEEGDLKKIIQAETKHREMMLWRSKARNALLGGV